MADAEALPFEDGEFDAVLSCVGVMFAPHHEAATRCGSTCSTSPAASATTSRAATGPRSASTSASPATRTRSRRWTRPSPGWPATTTGERRPCPWTGSTSW
ncbi:class I SAM-dependent methyltransferase [Actinomadura luteofluorescens]|uniref:class I SAM-dependent methyltransferase n=1 Tax=Actinomadura luteofluorescens TaxID=46163 RepID=UPI0035E428B3